jgi:hypothetical protein
MQLSGEDLFSDATLRPINTLPENTCLDNMKSERLEFAKSKREHGKDSSPYEDSIMWFHPYQKNECE